MRAPRNPRIARRHESAFTLIEILMATAAGLVVVAAAVLLTRNASRAFQEEARMSAAHLAATLGLGRLAADAQRAAFLSTPNAARDPAVCGDRALWPAGLRRLAGITVLDGGSSDSRPGDLAQSIANELRPDALIIGGSFGNSELFPIRAVEEGPGGGQDVHLQIAGSGAMQRALARAAEGGASLEDLFRPGRFLRLLLPGQTRALFGVIAGVEILGAPPVQVVVRLAPSPPLPRRESAGCGLGYGANVGGLASPVARIRYDLRRLIGHPAYGALVEPISPEVTGDGGRTELVRVELDANDQEIPGTLELVAEYAVDLQIGVTLEQPGGGAAEWVRHPIGAADETMALPLAGDPSVPGAAPERVRALQIRLAARARAPDRGAALAVQPDGRRSRFLIPGLVPGVDTLADTPPPGAPPVYARMRTLHAEVSLPNQQRGGAW